MLLEVRLYRVGDKPEWWRQTLDRLRGQHGGPFRNGGVERPGE